MEQVVVNLLLNALDAVEGRDAAKVVVSVTAGETALIRVSDTGSGISVDDLPRVTEPFSSTKISGGGLGLGLSISQAIVGEFGGRIEIASTPGKGTDVSVSLPLVAAEPLAGAAE
jgi:two-component system C4-dicarboxylate transport sensor histidine kinase DctB